MNEDLNSSEQASNNDDITWSNMLPDEKVVSNISGIEEYIGHEIIALIEKSIQDPQLVIKTRDIKNNRDVVVQNWLKIESHSMDQRMPNYHIRGLTYTDGKVAETKVHRRLTVNPSSPPMIQRMLIDNPNNVVICDWRFAENPKKSSTVFQRTVTYHILTRQKEELDKYIEYKQKNHSEGGISEPE